MNKKIVYISLVVLIASIGGFFCYFYFVKDKQEKVSESAKNHDPNSGILLKYPVNTGETKDENTYESPVNEDEDEDKDEYLEYEDNYFNNIENTDAYRKYLSEIQQYGSTGTIDFLWHTTPAQTGDSIVAAITYAEENYLSYSFNMFNGDALPDFVHHGRYVNEDGETKANVWIVPTTIREYSPSESSESGAGAQPYKTLIEFLSKGRQTIDFHKLYTTYKRLVHQVIPKERYDEEYRYLVENLFAAYQDFERNENLYDEVESIMNHEWQTHVSEIKELDPGYGSSTRHGDFFPYFEEILPEVSVKLFKNKVRNMDESDLVWTYSFWLRRHNEGNTDNIIKTLRSIRHDYDGME